MNLWHNSLLKVGYSQIYYKTWATKGVREVRHLMKDENSFLSLTEFREHFNIKINYLTFHGIIAAIRPQRKLLRGNDILSDTNEDNFAVKFFQASKPNKLVYNKLISLKQTSPSGSQSKWIADCNLEFPQLVNWNAVYETPFCCTKASKLIVFQFKLFHRRLATNDYLHKIGLRNDDICTFCKNGKESLAHLFWHCKETFSFWGRFQDLLTGNQVTIKEKNYSMDLVLRLKIDVFSHLQHYFYFLVARYFIWTCKMKEIIPSINNFVI